MEDEPGSGLRPLHGVGLRAGRLHRPVGGALEPIERVPHHAVLEDDTGRKRELTQGSRGGRAPKAVDRDRGEPSFVDVEREVELGGPIHSKGVLILAGVAAVVVAGWKANID